MIRREFVTMGRLEIGTVASCKDLVTWRLPGRHRRVGNRAIMIKVLECRLAEFTLTWTRSRLCFVPNHMAGRALYSRTPADPLHPPSLPKPIAAQHRNSVSRRAALYEVTCQLVRYRVRPSSHASE